MERLRHVYRTVKPVKEKVLPSNWKRFAKAELMDLYAEKLKPTSRDYLKKTKDMLIMELEIWAEDEEVREVPNAQTMGSCTVERQNKISIWGCAAFPACKGTLSKVIAGKPAAVAQAMAAQAPALGGYKAQVTESGEDMNGEMTRRAVRTPVPSVCSRIGSFVQRPLYAKSGCITGSKDCSDQGGELIKELRHAKQ